MSNIMQYLIQMADEFRESYEEIKKAQDELLEKQSLVDFRLQEIEQRLNKNLD